MRKNDVLLVGDERSAKKSGMAEFYRTEVRAHESTGNIEGSPRFVVIVEIPEKVTTGLEPSQLETKAYEVAWDATRAQRITTQADRINNPSAQFLNWTSTPLVDANLDDYGDADFTTEDRCRAWIKKGP
jgi:hypothetical protein